MLRSIDLKRCPVDQALEVIGGKWKPLILWRLAGGTLRFGQLQRAIPGVTQRMLTLQLRELERDGLVVRTVHAAVPPRVDYTLTAPARGLLPVMEAMGDWLLRHHRELESISSNVGTGDASSARDSHRSGNVRAFRIAK